MRARTVTSITKSQTRDSPQDRGDATSASGIANWTASLSGQRDSYITISSGFGIGAPPYEIAGARTWENEHRYREHTNRNITWSGLILYDSDTTAFTNKSRLYHAHVQRMVSNQSTNETGHVYYFGVAKGCEYETDGADFFAVSSDTQGRNSAQIESPTRPSDEFWNKLSIIGDTRTEESAKDRIAVDLLRSATDISEPMLLSFSLAKGRISPMAYSRALEFIARVESPETEQLRKAIFLHALQSNEDVIRYGAASALVGLGVRDSASAIEIALQSESNRLVKQTLEAVLESFQTLG